MKPTGTPTETFPITTGNGDIVHVEGYIDESGKVSYWTEDGEKVIKEEKGLYSVPSQGISGTDSRATR